MNARPDASDPLNFALLQQLLERVSHAGGTQAAATLVEQQRRVGIADPLAISTIQVLPQLARRGGTQHNPAGLAEPALGDVQLPLIRDEMLDIQSTSLSDTDAGGIEKP